MRVTTIVLTILLAGGWPRVARAGHPSVAKAQRAYEQLRFEDVLREIAEARKSGSLSRADDVELTRLEAFTYAVYDDGGRAVDAFGRLLGLQPTWAPPADTSPKIRRYFEDARARRRTSAATAPPDRQPARDETPPFYASGWFWGSLAVAVGAGVGAGIFLTRSEPGSPRGNLGTLELP
jgi:hypothetical protein